MVHSRGMVAKSAAVARKRRIHGRPGGTYCPDRGRSLGVNESGAEPLLNHPQGDYMKLACINLARLTGFILALAFSAAFAQEMKPEEMVRRVTEDVLAAIKSDSALQAGDRQKALALAEQKVMPHIDFGEATKLAVGKAWSAATP